MWDRTRVVAVCAATGVVASAFAYWKVRGYFNRKLKEKEIMRHVSAMLHAGWSGCWGQGPCQLLVLCSCGTHAHPSCRCANLTCSMQQ